MTSSVDYVHVNLLTFSVVRDRVEASGERSNTNEANKYDITLQSSWPTGHALRQFICGHVWPCLADIETSIALALNLHYLDLDQPVTLTAQDTLAMIPPISGG